MCTWGIVQLFAGGVWFLGLERPRETGLQNIVGEYGFFTPLYNKRNYKPVHY